jgi:hypothetical protein
MLFRTRAERRIKIVSDLRQAEKLRVTMRTNLPETQLPVGALPPWCDREYRRAEIRYNPFRLTCSCEQRQQYLAVYAADDARGLCVHLARHVKRADVPELQLAVLIAEASHRSEKLLLAHVPPFWFGYTVNSPWIQIFMPGKKWAQASFDRHAGRWAYNVAPANAAELLEILKREFWLD